MWITWYADAYVLVQQWKSSPLCGLISAMLCACAGEIVIEYLSAISRKRNRMERFSSILVSACLHTIHVMLGYILMLFVMTYSAWIIISAVAGSAMGYLMFGHRFRKAYRNQGIIRHSSKLSCNFSSPAHLLLGQPEPSQCSETTGTPLESQKRIDEQHVLISKAVPTDPNDINIVLGFISTQDRRVIKVGV